MHEILHARRSDTATDIFASLVSADVSTDPFLQLDIRIQYDARSALQALPRMLPHELIATIVGDMENLVYSVLLFVTLPTLQCCKVAEMKRGDRN